MTTTPTQQTSNASRASISSFFERFGLLALLLGLGALFVLTKSPEQFKDIESWQNIGKSASVLILASLALLIPLISGHFNLAVGAQIGASGMLCASAFSGKHWFEGNGLPISGAIAIAILASIAVSALAGYLVAYVGVNSLITTLGIAIGIQGWYDWYAQGVQISVESETLTSMFREEVPLLRMPPAFMLSLVAAVIIWFITELTPFGRRIAAVGSNPQSAGLVGIRVERTIFFSFLISGFLAGLAGVVQLASLGSASASTFPGGGVPFILPALAAVFLGATTWKAGRFNVPGMVIAILLVKLSTQAFIFAGIESWIETVFNGVALVIAVAASTLLARRRAGG